VSELPEKDISNVVVQFIGNILQSIVGLYWLSDTALLK
jgi:hypothetical protein